MAGAMNRGPSRSTTYCTHCPKLCRCVCPVAQATHNERYTPWAKQSLLHEVESGRLDLTRPAARTLYACLDCAATVPFCRHEIAPPSDLLPARSQSVSRGVYRPGEALVSRFAERGSPYPKATRARLAELAPDAREDGEWLFLPGCAALAGEGDDARAAATLLSRFAFSTYRVDPRVLCGGYPLLALGHAEAFAAHEAKIKSALAPMRRIVTLCPACLPILRANAPPGAEVLHSLALADRLFADAPVRGRRQPGKAAYHDPCRLARRESRLIAAPRRLLGDLFAGGMVEFPWHGAETRCTGGGGALPLTFPKTAWKILESRLEEFERTGAGVLVTSCPTCLTRFRRAARGRFPVRDAVEVLVAASLP